MSSGIYCIAPQINYFTFFNRRDKKSYKGNSLKIESEFMEMELEFKPDFSEAQKQWKAFWNGKNRRPLVCVTLPKEGMEPVEKPPYTSGADGNFEPVIDQLLAWAASHIFIGEAIPFYYLEFGPDHFSALLGADLKFDSNSPGTSWCQPFIKDWDDAEIRFRRDSFWWKRTVDFAHALRKRCDGKLLIAAPTLVANLDALAAIRGAKELLLDLIMCPDKVQRALNAVCQAYEEILEALSDELGFDKFGSINRHGMYCAGKIDVLQCDFSCMISPAMFRSLYLPA